MNDYFSMSFMVLKLNHSSRRFLRNPSLVSTTYINHLVEARRNLVQSLTNDQNLQINESGYLFDQKKKESGYLVYASCFVHIYL